MGGLQVSPSAMELFEKELGLFFRLYKLKNTLYLTHVPCILHRKLGLQERFRDVGMRLSLLNFALTHCPPEEIQFILNERNTLEVQVRIS